MIVLYDSALCCIPNSIKSLFDVSVLYYCIYKSGFHMFMALTVLVI